MILLKKFFYSDRDELADHLSNAISCALIDDIAERGEALLVLPGGSSPITLISRLAQRELPWDKVQITVTDERCVPVESEYSNIGQVIRLFSECGRSVNAISLWSDEANSKLSVNELCWPATAVVLGMGLDGHVASLFPDEVWSKDGEMVIDVVAPVEPKHRVSLSFDTLLSCRNLVLLVNSKEKWDLFRCIEKGECNNTPLGEIINDARCGLQVHVYLFPF